MKSSQAIDKITLRLNKLASSDYQNIEIWKMEEAVNKAAQDWVRRQIKGKNQLMEGDEETSVKADDLSNLLKTEGLSVVDEELFSLVDIPEDYRYFKRLTPIVSKNNCSNINIKSTFVEEGNVDELLLNEMSKPSVDFEETFHTEMANHFKVYHNNDFKITKVNLTYYRQPHHINLEDPEYVWEFKDEISELLIDEAVKIIAGDTENQLQYQIANTRIETNN